MQRILMVGAVWVAGAAWAAEPASTPESVEKGKASFALNCAACHGSSGAGDGPAAAALNPKPRNLLTEPLKNGEKPSQVFETLKSGVSGTPMVGFAHLSEEERWGLVHYVLSLRKVPAAVGKPKAAKPVKK